MTTLIEKLQRLERMEEIAKHAEADYEREPENTEAEELFDLAYQNEFNAYMDAANYIVSMTGGKIDFMTAKKLVKTNRNELLTGVLWLMPR